MSERSSSARDRTTSAAGRIALSRREIDASKGVLIALIVLGHNTLAQAVWPGLWPFLYNFHVFCFLLLPFLYPPREIGVRFVADRAVRYLVPYAVFFTVSAVAFAVVEKRPISGTWILIYLEGLVVGSAAAVDAASGFRLYWFLPTLFSLVIARSAFHSMPLAGRGALLALAVAGFLLAGRLPEKWIDGVPLGLPIVAYVFLPGLVVGRLWSSTRRASLAWMALSAALTFGFLSLVAFERETSLVIARLSVYSVLEPLSLAVHAGIAIAAFTFVLAASPWLSSSGLLAILGRYSLTVYLSHGLIYQALLRALAIGGVIERPSVTAAIATYAVTLTLSLSVALSIAHVERLRRLVTPRSVADLTGVLRRSATRVEGSSAAGSVERPD